MALVPQFFVSADYKAVIGDTILDADSDVDLGPLTATVTFTPNTTDVLLITGASPRPVGWVPAPVVARIDTDGRLKMRTRPEVAEDLNNDGIDDDDDIGIWLLANSPLLNLDPSTPLQWHVEFSNVRYDGKPGPVKDGPLKDFWFLAGNNGDRINLINVGRVPGFKVVGLSKGDPGTPGKNVDDVALVGDLVQFYVDGSPIGDPLALTVSVFDMSTIDGGTPDAEGLETLDGGGVQVSGSTLDIKRMQQRRGTTSAWTSLNPIPAAGEIVVGLNTDGSIASIRVGDGTHHFLDLTAFATTSAITAAINAVIDAAPGSLDTLKELATALGNDPNFATTVTNSIAARYIKPVGGIPAADLTSDVQTSLGSIPNKADKITTITGANSITGGGDLSANRTLALVNDQTSPGNSKVYGTDSSGVKGWQTAASGGGTANTVTTHTTSSTGNTTPTGIKGATVSLIAAGMGGGSGRRGAAGTVRNGGGGGAGSSLARFNLPATFFGSTYDVNVPAGGTGGAAVTTNDTNGNAGNYPLTDTSLTSGSNKVVCTNSSTPAGGGGAAGAPGGAGFTSGVGQFLGQGGASSDANGGPGSFANAAYTGAGVGAGSGGGITSGDVAGNGGVGGAQTAHGLGNLSGGVVDGTAPASAYSPPGCAGQGGGGGAASKTQAAQAGANGGVGSGGGGGGASLNGFNSGKGGDGGPALIQITWHF